MTEPRPLVLAVDGDRESLERVERELGRRLAGDLRVRGERTAAAAGRVLEEARADGAPVALVLAGEALPDGEGAALLARARALHPESRRALLIDWGAWGDGRTADAILAAIGRGDIDYYVLRPWQSPDELFHRTVAELVHEWSRGAARGPAPIAVVAPAGSPRGHEVRSLLARNGLPHAFEPRETALGRMLLAEADAEDSPAEVVVVLHAFGGRVLLDPSNRELAEAYGVRTTLGGIEEVDLAVVGAGPAGLAAAVYGASEGLSTLVVERESIGGQAGSSSLIRNYLGFARGVSGAELAQRGYQQAWVFGARFALMREVVGLVPGAHAHVLELDGGETVRARAVVLGMGVAYRRLGVPALEALTGAGVFYGASVSEARALAGRRAYVVGGGNSAGQAAMHLQRHAAHVALVVRGPSLAATMSRYLIDALAAAPNVEVLLGTEVVEGDGDGRLERVLLRDRATGAARLEPADGLFVLIGAQPHTGWLPDAVGRDGHGFLVAGPDVLRDAEASARWPLERAPLPYETCLPGVFAVGDVRARSVKRVAAAVGEGSVVVSHVHERLAELDAPAAAPAG